MTCEVEQKYVVDSPAELTKQIVAAGGERGKPIRQIDAYFAHPSRDFAQTDEALRLRRVGDSNMVTYKGPKLDATTKTRREIELPLAEGGPSFQSWTELLAAIGFKLVREVAKTRTPFRLAVDGRELEIVLDEVEGLGWFVEIETIAEEIDLDNAHKAIAEIASKLHLGASERRSYLELLLLEDHT